MKIRTDFVTNSSSSSFVAIHLKSQSLADFFSERMEEIEENNDGFCDVEVNVEGDDVSIECGDSDVPFFDAPRSIDDAVSMLMEICHLETNGSEPEELAETIEEIEWSSETMGLDGDDGRFDQDNYDPDVLEELMEEIAECNDCDVDDVTDDMFRDYVTPECDDITEQASFTYNKKTGEGKYFHTDGMHRESFEIRQNSRSKNGSKNPSQKNSKRMDEKPVCGFCDRKCNVNEVVRKRMPDGSICTVCKTCCKEYDLSDWETVENE